MLATRRIKQQKKQLVLLITFGLDEKPQQQQQQPQQATTSNVNNTNNKNQTSNQQQQQQQSSDVIPSKSTVATTSKPTTNKLKNQLAKLGGKFARDKVTLAVVGVGDEAIRNRKGFEDLLNTDMTKDTTKAVSKTMKTKKTADHHLLLSDDEYILEVLYYSVKFSKNNFCSFFSYKKNPYF